MPTDLFYLDILSRHLSRQKYDRTFPDDLTPFDFINKNMPSIKRNRLILDVLFRSKDVEKAGTGFQRVNEICNDNGITWDYRKKHMDFSLSLLDQHFILINRLIKNLINKKR